MGVGRTYPLKDLCVIVLRIASDSLPSDFPYRKITPMKVGERENDLNHLILLMKKKKKKDSQMLSVFPKITQVYQRRGL